jgi:hypothetical protein
MKKLFAVLFGIVLALALAEGLLRLLWHPAVAVSGWRCSASVPEEEKNQLGFRGHPMGIGDSTTVVLLLGDSQVEATHLPWARMPERMLEEYLEDILGRDIAVASVAAPGYGQDQELLALEYYFESYPADLVALWETPTNDLWNNTFPTHWPANGWAKPTFWLENGSLRGPSEEMGDPLSDQPLRLPALLAGLGGSPDRDGEWEERLPAAYRPAISADGPVGSEWQHRWDTDLGMMRSENLSTEKSHLAIYLTPRSERMQYSIDLTRELLLRIDSVASANGARLFLFAAAGPPDTTAAVDLATYVLNGFYYTVSALQYEENVASFNKGMDFVEIPVAVEDWRVSPTDSHLNEAATDSMMREVALLIASRLAERDARIQVE